MPKYKRILLKVSGEVLQGKEGHGIDFGLLQNFAKEIADIRKGGTEVAIVVGGGNIWRYRDSKGSGIDRVTADKMGMVATVLNSMALQGAIENLGVPARACSAFSMNNILEPYRVRRAIKHMDKGRVVICAGGTGNPYFTTDTAAALRALELSCDVLLKATNVDGVYDKDPTRHKNAKLYNSLSYTKFLSEHLKVMDATAVSLCREEGTPILLFNITKKGNIKKAASGGELGTLIHK